MDQSESLTLKNNSSNQDEEETSKALPLRLLFPSSSKSIQRLKYRCHYISKEQYDELDIAIDDRKEEATAFEAWYMKVWSDFPDLNELKGLSDCSDIGCFDF